jgi:hypothetical protein
MLLGFKRRFAPFVLDGSKTHTRTAKYQELLGWLKYQEAAKA